MIMSQGNGAKRRPCRRSNGRSITGCLNCRKRRIKCDEKRPRCLNCKQSHACTYGTIDPTKEWRQKILTFNFSSASMQPAATANNNFDHDIMQVGVTKHKERQDTRTEPWIPASPSAAVHGLLGEGYDMRDVQLLSHFVTNTAYHVIGRHDEWIREGVQLAFTNDFLMHAMLMLAASHLGQVNPRSGDYPVQSARHLRHSITSFRTYLSTHTSISSNVDAVIATCFLFIIHSYSTPIFEPKSSILDPLLCHSSGVFDIIRYQQRHAWPRLFQPICIPELLPTIFPRSGPALDLILMVTTYIPDNAVPDPNEKVYLCTIESLTLILETITTRPEVHKTPSQSLLLYLVKWLSFLPLQFVTLLNMHDPRALVIIAYYYGAVASVLSSATTDWWWMRDRPVYMVQQITAFLGRPWEIWMKWPNEVIDRYQDTNHSVGMNTHWGIVEHASSENNTTLGVLSRTLPQHGKIGADKLPHRLS